LLMLSVLRGFAVRLRPRHAATSPSWEECPEQADLRVVALMAKTARSSAYSAVWCASWLRGHMRIVHAPLSGVASEPGLRCVPRSIAGAWRLALAFRVSAVSGGAR
jgi:hypothetical protein